MASSPSSPEISAATGAETHSSFSYKHATEEEIMEDLSSRFILNLPDEELTSLERICFQVEQAHWFYEDFIREENRRCHSLPLKRFTAMMFSACPILQQWNHEEAFQKFMQYKTLVPVCGAIMLNETWDKCVLVKGWKSSSGWGFPKGKINETEPKADCAVREVLEETGYNLGGKIKPEHFIETTNNGQRVTLFIVGGVPEDYPFRTKTRKEISKIEWFKLTDLPAWRRNKHAPGKFYLIAPFISALKTFVNANKPRKSGRKPPPTPKLDPSPSAEAQSTNATDTEALHDSSSQSSSLDNGGPQTPSPQYTESTPAFVPAIAGEQAVGPIPSDALDPHFARLLSGLSLSAVVPVEEEKNAKADSNVNATLHAILNSRDPVSSTQTRSTTVPPQQPLQSTSATLPLGQDAADRTSDSSTAVGLAPATQGVAPRSIPIPRAASTKLGQKVPAANCSTSPSTSPRSPTFRKSSTADISPYLTRPTEVPVSAKRLQQLALLESVADESARMTPKLVNRAPFAAGGSVYPPPLPDSRMFNSFHPSAPKDHRPMAAPLSGHYVNPHYPQQNVDPFMVRSRTSQAIHRTGFHSPPGSASMNHNQLLSLINNSQPGVPPPPLMTPQFPGPPPFHNNPPYAYVGAPQSMHQVQPGLSPQYHRQFESFPPPPAQIPGPRPFSVVQTTANPSAGALLSILNSNPSNILQTTLDPQFSRV